MGLDIVEFIMAVEDHYSITLPNEDLETLTIVGDFVVYVANACEMQNGQDVSFESVYETVKQRLLIDFGIPERDITLKSHFVDDLAMS